MPGSRPGRARCSASGPSCCATSRLGAVVLHHEDIAHVHEEVRRTVTLLDRYRQRAHDLVYDSVSLELGGSE